MLKKIFQVVSILGILFFIYYFIKLGPESVLLKIKELSIGNFFILFTLRLVYWLVRTLNWYMVLKSLDENSGFLKVLVARIAGHSVGFLSPAAKVGGEVVRVFLFGKSERKRVTASVIVEKMIEYIATMIMVTLGVAAAILFTDLRPVFKYGLLGLTGILVLVVLFFFRKQKSGFLAWFREKIKVGDKYFRNRENDIQETDGYISSFYREHKPVFFTVFFLCILNYLVWVFEVYMTLLLLGSLNITLLKSFLITTLGTFAFIFPLLPGSVGMFEATYIGLFELVEVAPVIGVGYIIVRRILGLILAGVGLIPLFRSGFSREKNSRV